MRSITKFTGGLAAAALLVGAAAPANADRGRYEPRRQHHHDRGPSAGAVIGAVAAVGLIAAIASSAAKKKAEKERRYEELPPPAPRYDPRYDARDDYAPRYDSRADGPAYADGRARLTEQDDAVDACVIAARDEASRLGGFAQVRDITGVSPLGTGWDITGRVEQRASYRATNGDVRGFRCAFQRGQVSIVSLD